MMKTILILLLCARLARAETVLSFAAEISDESLAEDAILLVHCLSDRTGHGWEFTGEARGPLFLHLREEERQVRGVYHRDGKDLPVAFRSGGADEACEALEPAAKASPFAQAARAPIAAEQRLGSLSGEANAEAQAPSKHGWIWAAAGLAALGGFLLWRAHQPSYRSVEMR